MTPPLQSLATRTVDETVRGGVLGIYQSAVSLATIISTAVAGLIFSVHPTMPYWVAASLSFLLIFPGLALPRIMQGNGARPPGDRPHA
jgi:MFS family permease